jgi:uncharacterized membrane protein YdjX (TVP38/TMEM64 family)
MPELFDGRNAWGSVLGLVLVLGALFAVFHYFDIEAVRAYIEGAGVWAPLLLVLAKASTVIVAPLGGSPLYPLGGALFGFWKGAALLLAGDAIGGIVTFYLSRILGRAIVERMLAGQSGLIDAALEMMSSVKGFFVARTCLMTFPELASYTAGLTRLPFAPFIAIHVLVGIPPTLVGVGLGELIARGMESAAILAATVIAGAVSVGGMLLFVWMVQKHAAGRAASSEPPLGESHD